MRTQVFAHKGYIGIKSDVKAEGLLNDPMKPGQLGFVLDAAYVDVQPAALELLKKVKKSGDDIGEIDVYKSPDKTYFCWLGGPLKVSDPCKITGSNVYDASLLQSNDSVVTPQDFINFVESRNS
jgi:hypothetical protein